MSMAQLQAKANLPMTFDINWTKLSLVISQTRLVVRKILRERLTDMLICTFHMYKIKKQIYLTWNEEFHMQDFLL